MRISHGWTTGEAAYSRSPPQNLEQRRTYASSASLENRLFCPGESNSDPATKRSRYRQPRGALGVDDFVAVKALRFNKIQQRSEVTRNENKTNHLKSPNFFPTKLTHGEQDDEYRGALHLARNGIGIEIPCFTEAGAGVMMGRYQPREVQRG